MKQCANCKVDLQNCGVQKLQMGQSGILFPNLGNIVAGALEVQVMLCPQCGKIEFFSPHARGNSSQSGTKRCPKCGDVHDASRAKCTRCSHVY